MSADPIRRYDLEAKFRELQGSIEGQIAPVRDRARKVGPAVVVGVLLVVYLLGLRSGRRRSTIVEVRRF